MSTDARVTRDLIETLEDGKEGFAAAAEKLAESDRSDVAPQFQRVSQQRAAFAAELDALAAEYGDDIDESGSVAGTLHRAWMAVKDTFSGSDPDAVLDAAEQGEDHAVAEFEKALGADISPTLRAVVARQLTEIRTTHDKVRALRNTV